MKMVIDVCILLLNEGLTRTPLRQSIILPLLGSLKVPMGWALAVALSNAIIRKPVYTKDGYNDPIHQNWWRLLAFPFILLTW